MPRDRVNFDSSGPFPLMQRSESISEVVASTWQIVIPTDRVMIRRTDLHLNIDYKPWGRGGERGKNYLHFRILSLVWVKLPISKHKNVYKGLTGNQTQNLLIKIIMSQPITTRSLSSIVLMLMKVGTGSQVNIWHVSNKFSPKILTQKTLE